MHTTRFVNVTYPVPGAGSAPVGTVTKNDNVRVLNLLLKQ
jgi:hypothetical protein